MRRTAKQTARFLLGFVAGATFLACTVRAADILPPDTTSKAVAIAMATNNMAMNPSGTNKMILMIISDTNSCTACVSLEFGILPSKAVSDLIAESFVYWACGPEQHCTAYTEYTGNGSVALPTAFVINPYSPRGVFQYTSSGADSASTYYQWLATSLMKSTAPRITQIQFPNPTTAVVSGQSISTNVQLARLRYKVNDGAWTTQQIPSGTWGSTFVLPPITVAANTTSKLYVYGLDSSGTYRTKTNVVNVVPTQQNVKVDPTVNVAVSPSGPSTYGALVTLTATVSGNNGTASGTVQFFVNGSTVGNPVALAAGSASSAALKIARGEASIKAVYSGDANYNGKEGWASQLVNPATITVTATGNNRQYDGTTAATVNLSTTGVAAGENVTVSYGAAAFDNKNTGNGKSIAITSLLLSGPDVANYQLANTTIGANANITPRSLTVTAVADTKTFNNTTASAQTPQVTSGTVIPGDTTAFSQTFETAQVGTNIRLTPTGTVQDQNSGNNYDVTFVPVNAGVIQQASGGSLTVIVTPANIIITNGQSLTLSAQVANGAGGEAYQWQKDNANIPGATASTYTIASASADNAGAYRVVANPASASATSGVANVWVTGAPKVYFGLPVYGPSAAMYFQENTNLVAGGVVYSAVTNSWSTITNSGVRAVGPQVIVSEEISSTPSTNRIFRLLVSEKPL